MGRPALLLAWASLSRTCCLYSSNSAVVSASACIQEKLHLGKRLQVCRKEHEGIGADKDFCPRVQKFEPIVTMQDHHGAEFSNGGDEMSTPIPHLTPTCKPIKSNHFRGGTSQNATQL